MKRNLCTCEHRKFISVLIMMGYDARKTQNSFKRIRYAEKNHPDKRVLPLLQAAADLPMQLISPQKSGYRSVLWIACLRKSMYRAYQDLYDDI